MVGIGLFIVVATDYLKLKNQSNNIQQIKNEQS